MIFSFVQAQIFPGPYTYKTKKQKQIIIQSNTKLQPKLKNLNRPKNKPPNPKPKRAQNLNIFGRKNPYCCRLQQPSPHTAFTSTRAAPPSSPHVAMPAEKTQQNRGFTVFSGIKTQINHCIGGIQYRYRENREQNPNFSYTKQFFN
ncbi:hypothetical protein V6Z11_A09G151200 [Gossypium hirsutum]